MSRLLRAALVAALGACWTAPRRAPPPPAPSAKPSPPPPVEPLAAAGSVTGVVRELRTRIPISHATVELIGADGKLAATNTDANGHYQLLRVPAGDYQLVVRSHNGPSAQQPVSIYEDREARVDFDL